MSSILSCFLFIYFCFFFFFFFFFFFLSSNCCHFYPSILLRSSILYCPSLFSPLFVLLFPSFSSFAPFSFTFEWYYLPPRVSSYCYRLSNTDFYKNENHNNLLRHRYPASIKEKKHLFRLYSLNVIVVFFVSIIDKEERQHTQKGFVITPFFHTEMSLGGSSFISLFIMFFL